MIKEKRILSYFIGWLFLGLIICFIGISKTYALTTTEYEDITYLNDYTIYYVKADYTTSPLEIEPTNEYQLDQVTAFLVNVDNYTFNSGVTYNIEISMPLNTLTNANRYTVSGDNNITCTVTQIDNTNPNFPNFTFNCPNTTQNIALKIFNSNGNYIVNTGLFRWNYTFLRKQITTLDLGVIENQQSQIIDQNQQIIQGQDNIQNTIKDQFNTCRDSVNLFNLINKTTTSNGITSIINNNTISISGTATSGWFNITTGQNVRLQPGTYTVSVNKPLSNFGIDFYNNSQTVFSLPKNTKSRTFTINEEIIIRMVGVVTSGENININDLKLQIQEGSIATSYEEPNQEICSNKIDETNDKLDGIQGALTDSSAPNTSSLENSAGWLPAGPLDSILNLPLTMLNSLTNSLGKTCSPLNLTLPYVNKNIQIPCLSAIFAQITGVNGLWTWVGTIASVLILYNYLLNLYAWVDRVLTLRAEFDEAMGADLANWGRL